MLNARQPPRRVWLANVGANSSHPYSSPLFDDGTFELLPIVETPPVAGPHSVTFGDLTSFNHPGESLSGWVPSRVQGAAAHLDPEFTTYTYGDNCGRAPRAAALKKAAPGDLIFFVARLWPWRSGNFVGVPAFYLVGFLEVESVLADVASALLPDALSRYGANAHVRKGLNHPAQWDGFWVFGGSVRSRRLRRAVPIDRAFSSAVLLDAKGAPWRWDSRRTDLQVIGSYTRSCRCIIDPTRPDAVRRLNALSQRVEQFNPGVWPE